MNPGKAIPLRFLLYAFTTQAKTLIFRVESGKTNIKSEAEHEDSRKTVRLKNEGKIGKSSIIVSTILLLKICLRVWLFKLTTF